MIDINIIDETQLIAFWLIFCRWGAILMQIPLFDTALVAMPIKVLSTLVVSYAFHTTVLPLVVTDIKFFGTENLVFLTIAYLVIGLTLAKLVFKASGANKTPTCITLENTPRIKDAKKIGALHFMIEKTINFVIFLISLSV